MHSTLPFDTLERTQRISCLTVPVSVTLTRLSPRIRSGSMTTPKVAWKLLDVYPRQMAITRRELDLPPARITLSYVVRRTEVQVRGKRQLSTSWAGSTIYAVGTTVTAAPHCVVDAFRSYRTDHIRRNLD